MVHDENQLRYYWEELLYLRKMGESFARTHPKVAGRLELEADVCPDPHVERLIESFAFLTGRIQYSLDQDFPEIAAELIRVLYPHYLDPVPSMTVARFEVDAERGKLTGGYEIPRGTRLFALSDSHPGALCRFRTAYPVTLWPLEVTAAAFEAPERWLDDPGSVVKVLRLRLSTLADPVAKLGLGKLRFYLHGEQTLAGELYELLLNHVVRLAARADGSGRLRDLPPGSVEPVGFRLEEALLPAPEHAQPAYRLLQEYFAFQEKFQFFDVGNLDRLGQGLGQGFFDLLFFLDRLPEKRLSVTPEVFALGCTPVVNLFTKTTEPLRVDHRRLEYRLVFFF
ncbi:MAG: type VI secretion system baseplate subunit TssF, partial [Acidobacteria bacterium]|nr:type VI secretion system baseplate subunit TssF [Acidobacteriota bacterium]